MKHLNCCFYYLRCNFVMFSVLNKLITEHFDKLILLVTLLNDEFGVTTSLPRLLNGFLTDGGSTSHHDMGRHDGA